MKRALCILACLGAVALGGQTATINDVKFAIGRKVNAVEHVTFQGVSVYEATVIATGEDATVVSGYLVSHLPTPNFTFRLCVDLWQRATSSTPGATAEAVVSCPEPGKPTRFLGFSVIRANIFKAYSIRYTFVPVTAKDFARPKASPVPGQR